MSAPIYYKLPAPAGSVAIADIDGDGRLDLLTANGQHFSQPGQALWVFRQLPGGFLDQPQTIAGHAASSYVSMAAADFDGSPGIDVVIASSGGLTLFRNSGGTLMAGARINPPAPLSAALPLAIGSSGGVGLMGASPLGGGQLARNLHSQPQYTAWDAPVSGTLRLAVGRLDSDNLPDVAAASTFTSDTRISVSLNLGNGALGAVQFFDGGCPSAPVGPSGLGIGDVTGDGRNDIVALSGTSSDSSCVIVIPGAPGGGFGATVHIPLAIPIGPLVVADANMDGRSDIIIARSASVTVVLQSTQGRLDLATIYQAGTVAPQNQPLAVGDLNGDRCPDVAVAHEGGVFVMHGLRCDPLMRSDFE